MTVALVQSIPAVFALANGQVVDTFIGAQPEDKIREFVNGLIAGENDAEPFAHTHGAVLIALLEDGLVADDGDKFAHLDVDESMRVGRQFVHDQWEERVERGSFAGQHRPRHRRPFAQN